MAPFLTHLFTVFILMTTSCSASLSKEILPDELQENGLYRTQRELNREVVQKGIAVYLQLNQNYTLRNEEEDASTNSPFWSPKAIPISKDVAIPFLYLSNPKIAPSHALDDLVAKGGVMECLFALSVAKASILKALIGNDLFDAHVSECIQNGLSRTNPALLHRISEPFITTAVQDNSTTFMYIPNIPDYIKLYPTGAHLGENVIRVDVDQFIGFGPAFKNGPLSLTEIEDLFYEDMAEWYAGIPELYAQIVEKPMAEVNPSEARKWYANTLGCSVEMERFSIDKIAFLESRRQQQSSDLNLFDVSKINAFIKRSAQNKL